MTNGNTYLIRTDCGNWQMEMDATNAAAPIRWREDDDDTWRSTPYQTANAIHEPRKAASLLAAYFGDCVGERAERIKSVTRLID